MSYLRGLEDARFQQDNAKPHVSRRVLIYLDTEGDRLFLWPTDFSDFSLIDNIWSRVAERLDRHHSPATTIDEVCHRLKTAGNDLSISVNQA